MNSLLRYLLEKLQSKTGLGAAVLVGYGLQVLFGVVSAVLFLIALFFVVSDYFGFGSTATSIGMFLVFVLLFVISMLWTSSAKRKTIAEAERALQAHSFVNLNAPLFNAGLQLGQKIGWRKAIPTVLGLFVASGVAAEWSRRRYYANQTDR